MSKTLTFGEIPDDLELDEPYSMRLNQPDLSIVAEAINQGIDSRLEAVSVREIAPGHIEIQDGKSMRTLLRRLMEAAWASDDPFPDNGQGPGCLASDIMTTLGYEWV